jgi:hypothetical protein
MYFSDYPPAVEQPLCLSQAEWQNPKTVITVLFELYDYVSLKKRLRQWLKTVMADRRLPRKALYYAQELKEHLTRLLEAGCLMKPCDKSHLPKNADWMDSRWWLIHVREDHMSFDYFPTSLSRREYKDPYRVIIGCLSRYTLPDWRNLLEDTWLAGLTTDTLYSLQDIRTANHVCRVLPKLLDAVHLIYVRELSTS